MVGRYPNLNEEVVKSPLYLTRDLPTGQLPHVLWRWHVGLLSQNKDENKIHHLRSKMWTLGV